MKPLRGIRGGAGACFSIDMNALTGNFQKYFVLATKYFPQHLKIIFRPILANCLIIARWHCYAIYN